MAAEDVKRKLTAIFSADVVGYSRLMSEDEVATVQTLTSHKETMRKMIRQSKGRVVDSIGDNLMAEFTSVVDAVQCAVEVQQVLSKKNEDLPDNRRMFFRIGINLGDVIEEGERLYGDGVNIASRVESLAEEGGISLSGTAYDHLGKKLPLGYEYIGEQSVKNIEKPVRVYRVLTEAEAAGKVIGEVKPKAKQLRAAAIGAVSVLIIVTGALAIWNFYLRPPFEPASLERMAFPLPDKPSIAVLPFVNMSDDPMQKYLADGITENIISALSQVPKIFVIAHDSTYTYKGKPVKVQNVAEDLGVRYVLEGSVQRSDDSLRITAQFIDALSGHHLWSERYDRNLKDLFALQDEITMKIITALQVNITEGEQARLFAKGTNNLQAYLKFLEAVEAFFTLTKEGNSKARRLLEEVIKIDPEFAAAYDALGSIHFMEVRLGLSKSPKKSLKQAFELTKKAIALDDSYAIAHLHLGFLDILLERQYDKAIARGERAIELAPNMASAHAWMGVFLNYAGRHKEAVRYSKRALRLNPIPPGFYMRSLGSAYFGAGLYEEAITAHKKSLQRAPDDILTHLALATAYSWAGRLEEARVQADEVLRINPKFSVGQQAKRSLYKNQADRDRYLDGLRKAGLPEVPPLPLPDKPSIAVVPFDNLSKNPDQEYLAGGITDQIITGLSMMPYIFVIARNSSFIYKGKPVKVQQVAQELGVQYVMEGSVQQAGNRLRITAQLIDALTGRHVWSERYDRVVEDIFAVQDEIMMNIMRAMDVSVVGLGFLKDQPTPKSVKTYFKILKAIELVYRWNKNDNLEARKLYQEAIALEPEYGPAYTSLGWTYFHEVVRGWSDDPDKSLKQAEELGKKAIALGGALGHGLLTIVYSTRRQNEKAIAEGEKGLAVSPNNANLNLMFGQALTYAGRTDEAIERIKRAMRLNPRHPPFYFTILGSCYFQANMIEKAIESYEREVRLTPNVLHLWLNLAGLKAQLGRNEEAKKAAEEVYRIAPDYSWEKYSKAYIFPDKEVERRFFDGLRKVGLK